MKSMAILVFGALAFVVGTAKAMHHTQTADPFAAYWCRPAANAASEAGLLSLNAHCWGCGLAFVGALIVAGAAARLIAGQRKPATQRLVRMRALES